MNTYVLVRIKVFEDNEKKNGKNITVISVVSQRYRYRILDYMCNEVI
jgi:hypothetical protein